MLPLRKTRPANDQPHPTQVMSYVVLPYPVRRVKSMAAAADTWIFLAALFLAAVLSFSPAYDEKPEPALQAVIVPAVDRPVAAAQPEQPQVPFDIALNADADNQIVETPPLQADAAPEDVEAPPVVVQQTMAPVLEITVENKQPAPVEEDEAAVKAAIARKLADQGNIKQALAMQHRAAELKPDNMAYRLDLAILYDRAGNRKAASVLYRQVVQAYENGDASLPSTLGITDIRSRLGYLTASTER